MANSKRSLFPHAEVQSLRSSALRFSLSLPGTGFLRAAKWRIAMIWFTYHMHVKWDACWKQRGILDLHLQTHLMLSWKWSTSGTLRFCPDPQVGETSPLRGYIVPSCILPNLWWFAMWREPPLAKKNMELQKAQWCPGWDRNTSFHENNTPSWDLNIFKKRVWSSRPFSATEFCTNIFYLPELWHVY
jgi:hypothetical protein